MKKTNFFMFGMLALALAFGITVTSCTTRLGAFTVISTKSIDWSRAAEFTRSNQHVEGSDVRHIIIVFPTKYNITIEDAVDNALEKVPGAIALVDAVLRRKTLDLIIYGQNSFVVEGTALIDPKLASADGEATNYLVFHTEDGKEFKKTAVSKDEYMKYSIRTASLSQ
ncbi:MAG: hypothetical protein LBJ86_00675 [Spirochaetaceae bacterium]|jgi:hypothetical protein|nr:hypothetical protein [Spirochaetaceae bacterium]